jgi:vacuolar protein sorting-associated protein 45
MAHLKAVCFLRPTSANVDLLKKELSSPKYGEYHLCMADCLFVTIVDFDSFFQLDP